MRRLLLVDGDVEASQLVRVSLGERYDVRLAATRKQASQALRQKRVDLVLVESRLPDGCGLELLAGIRQRHPALPTIMLTGYGSEDVCATAFRLGVREYVKKPVDPAALVRVVGQVLASAPSRPAPGLADANGDTPAGAALNQRRIVAAVKYIQTNYRQRLTLPDVAHAVSMGKFSFSRTFSATMGVPFRTFLLRLRVSHATKLLESPAPGVTEVAGLVGFGDLSRFNKVFKKYIGVPPTAYRKRAMARSARKKAPSA